MTKKTLDKLIGSKIELKGFDDGVADFTIDDGVGGFVNLWEDEARRVAKFIRKHLRGRS